MTLRVELNIDLGEREDEPDELYRLAHRVNVACGGHAGDEASMRKACQLARASGAIVGAHPSYEDRAHFGRRVLVVPPASLRDSVRRQCASLRAVAAAEGTQVAHVKLHGALYHEAARSRVVGEAALLGARDALGSLPIIGPPSATDESVLVEGFADRRYDPRTGTLVDRSSPDALITNPQEAAEQARQLVRSGGVETICVHADTPGAVLIARAVREMLDGL